MKSKLSAFFLIMAPITIGHIALFGFVQFIFDVLLFSVVVLLVTFAFSIILKGIVYE